jgi:hypothetical protein
MCALGKRRRAAACDQVEATPERVSRVAVPAGSLKR